MIRDEKIGMNKMECSDIDNLVVLSHQSRQETYPEMTDELLNDRMRHIGQLIINGHLDMAVSLLTVTLDEFQVSRLFIASDMNSLASH